MTLSQVIGFVDAIEPNAYTNDQKTQWVSECEGMAYTEVFLLSPYEFHPLDYTDNSEEMLAVMPPHDKIYPLYLQAKIHFANGEYDRYSNAMAMFNAAWGEFVRWFARTYSPADGYRAWYAKNGRASCPMPADDAAPSEEEDPVIDGPGAVEV